MAVYYTRSGSILGASAWGGKTGVIDLTRARLASGGISKIGTTVYDATALGPVKYITDLEASFTAAFPAVQYGYLKYIVYDSASTSRTVMVSFKRNTTSGNISQSIFSLYGATPSVGAVNSILLYSNDDHDTLWMDGDGYGIIARTNTNNITNSTYDKFAGTTVTVTNSGIDSVANYAPAAFIASTSNFASPISFPATGAVLWFNLSLSQYKVNNFTAQSYDSNMTSYVSTAAPANTLITLSDGVNMFLVCRGGAAVAVEGKIDLTTGIVTTTTRSFNQSFYNTTEEDAIGAQLFAVDGSSTYQSGTSFVYTALDYTAAPTGWRDITTFSTTSSSTIGTLSTQTGMDVFGSIDTSDGYVWFADWGHDDGGLFNVGNDSQLGTAKSNIQKIPTTYTN